MYVRWRTRMVRASVINDLKLTLTDTDWLGATPLGLRTIPIKVVDGPASDPNKPLDKNTLALDNGMAGELELAQLGGGLFEQPYQFNFMFFAESDAVGHALMQDLADRYTGRTGVPSLALYDFGQATPVFVCNMEVESFDYARAPGEVAAYDQHLFFAELIITDFVED